MKNVLYVLEVLSAIALLLVSGVFVVCGIMNIFTYGVDWARFGVAIVVMCAASYWLTNLLED